jgi:UDP-glucuronate 4-epimerase
MKKILITGAAGFIGYHLAKAMAESGNKITGVDNLNDYYDVNLKKVRLAQLEQYGNFTFRKIDMVDRKAMAELFGEGKFEVVVNLAAQAGVRYSLKNPLFLH